ncbi:MAG: ribonuclease R, partial [Thermoanaerobaculia bacterium]
MGRRLLDRLESAGRRGCAAEELASALDGQWCEEEVQRTLRGLEPEGLVVESAHRWYALRFTQWVVGTIQLLERGDALIRSGRDEEAGYFAARRNLKGALDGDTVLVRPLRRKRRRVLRRLPEAAVVRILRRRDRTVVGTVEIGGERRWLVPFDPKNPIDLEVEGATDLMEDQFVVVEIADLGTGPVGRRIGRVRELLGSPETPGVDVRVVLRHFEIPENFPAAVGEEAARLPRDPAPSELGERQDLTEWTTVTIDGETARDFDDAISVEARGDGSFLLGVHIADVAHYVPEGSALDLEAYRRGTSVYFPERAIPMLPESLSNGLCSLRPGVPRLTLSALLDISPAGDVQRCRFAESVIRSDRRLTYREVRRLLEEPRASDRREYGEVLELLRAARRLMSVLLDRRTQRGSIDFDLPEGDVILDAEGFTVGVRPGERTTAHRIIEEFMIAANEAVAGELIRQESPALFRIHERPRPLELEELRLLLRPLGLALKGDLRSLHPAALQEVLRRVEGRPEEAFVSTLVLRTLLRAVYSPESKGHYALASQHYTHFTSPIRRYPDLVVHRRLKALLAGRGAAEAEESLLVQRLPAMAAHCSTTERRAEASERELLKWKLVRFLASRAGESFAGRITGIHPFGFFVFLEEYFIDGMVPIRRLTDDDYVFDPAAHELTGQQRGRIFRLGGEVSVVLTAVDLRYRSLELKVAGMSDPSPRLAERRPA